MCAPIEPLLKVHAIVAVRRADDDVPPRQGPDGAVQVGSREGARKKGRWWRRDVGKEGR